MSVSCGGLGLRESELVFLPAFLASRIAAKPLAVEMAEHAVAAGLVSKRAFMQKYDDRTQSAFNRFLAALPPAVHDAVREIAIRGEAEAADKWLTRKLGQAASARNDAHTRRVGQGLVLEAGEEDPERPDASGRSGPGLQGQFQAIIDECIREGLYAEHRSSESWGDINRLTELSHRHCNHDWLWRLNPNHGPMLHGEDYVQALRIRLGAGGPDEPVPCRLCKRGTLDHTATHCLCCALGEATRGHNKVRDELLSIARSADASAEKEAPGLIPSHPLLRPADVLTSATSDGRLSAMDVGICSPDAGDAGDDCTESMRQRKLGFYAAHSRALEAQGIVYTPMVWSCYGRPHQATFEALKTICKRAARRRENQKWQQLYRRAAAIITVKIWQRAARMTFACWPREGDLTKDL